MYQPAKMPVAILMGVAALSACTYVAPGDMAGPLLPPVMPLARAAQAPGATIVADNAGSLVGTLYGPAPTLISNSASTLIANSASTLIGNNAAGLVANGGASLTAGRSYELASAPAELTVPAAGAEVAAFDESGNRLTSQPVLTDGEGRFRLAGLSPSGGLVFVRATYQAAGHTVVLAAVTAAPREAGEQQIEVTPASALVAKKLDHLIAQRTVQPAAVSPERLARAAVALEAVLGAEEVVAAAILPTAQAASFFDRTLQRRPELLQALRRVDAKQADLLTTPAPGQAPLPRLAVAEPYLGAKTPGLADGRGEAARFAFPFDVAADAVGTLYVADYHNHCIRRVSPDGVVDTLAGDGQPGAADGPGATARFNYPRSVVVGTDGTVYVADAGNQCIRRIAPSGEVSLVAGTGKRGLQDGPAAGAMFDDPQGLAIDAAGNLYVADTGNRCVRRITPDGEVATWLTLAAPVSPDVPSGPYDVAIAADGRLFVADASSNAILQRGPDGGVQVLAGGPQGLTDGTGIGAAFKYPAGLAVGQDGCVYVADRDNHCIRRISPQGLTVTLAGNGTAGAESGVGGDARFHTPGGLAFGPDGTLYVADTFNHAIRQVRLPAP